MKFGQWIEYNMWNIFVEKSCTECCRQTIHRPFSKKIKTDYIYDIDANLRTIKI